MCVVRFGNLSVVTSSLETFFLFLAYFLKLNGEQEVIKMPLCCLSSALTEIFNIHYMLITSFKLFSIAITVL